MKICLKCREEFQERSPRSIFCPKCKQEFRELAKCRDVNVIIEKLHMAKHEKAVLDDIESPENAHAEKGESQFIKNLVGDISSLADSKKRKVKRQATARLTDIKNHDTEKQEESVQKMPDNDWGVIANFLKTWQGDYQ